jgi:muramoyltetrapeptide carboxypeptidase
MSTADRMPDALRLGGLPRSLSRRGLLRTGAAVTAGSLASASFAGAAAGTEASGWSISRPAALRPCDRVRVVAPAGLPDSRLDRGIEILTGFGLVVEVASHVLDVYGYLAGTDAARLADLTEAFADPGIRGVFAARGGYGTQRIIDGLDVEAIRRDPKVFVGFSDLTTLHDRLQHSARISSFYGPMVNWSDSRTGADSIESLRAAIMTTDPVVLTRDPAEPSAAVEVAGVASGVLLGGNLTMISTGAGAPDFPELAGAILLFEDVGEQPYSYDRMLTHLRRTGALSTVAGIVIGQLTDAQGGANEWDAASAIRDRVADLGVPVLGGLRIGHGPGQLTVPLGVPATLDTTAGTLTVEAGVCEPTTVAPRATVRQPPRHLPLRSADPTTPEW